MEMFIGISCFLFSYRLFQLAEAQENKLGILDVLKAFGRKLLRLVPVYWAIFLIAWGLYPRVTDGGPTWYLSAGLFEQCEDYWWARMLLIGNLVPSFSPPVTGCFFWGWVIDVDVQLTLVVPLFVYAYLFNRKFGHACVLICVVFGTFVNMAIVDKYNLKVGWLAPENWKMLAYLIEKPWNHIASMCMGVFFAQMYMELLAYRRSSDADEETKLREFYFTHYACNSSIIRVIMALLGVTLWAICFLSGN
jgi:peptidoglycan/LPS O-acetylase OafA/YrhL